MTNNLRNLGAAIAKSQFTDIPMEFVIPPDTKVVFVQDLHMKEYAGGAELTSEAFIRKCPHKIFQIHSPSLTIEMLERYPDVYWVFGNFTRCEASVLTYLSKSKIKYSVVEYDYKYCSYRSELAHSKHSNGQSCDCVFRTHGILIEQFYTNAEHIFWMSEKQKEHFLSRVPSLIFVDDNKHVVVGSAFFDETLDLLLSLRKVHDEAVASFPVKIWGVQHSSNWIKGTQETVNWCTQNKFPVKVIPMLPYVEFLTELAKCGGLVFHPLDLDTCPRIVIEAKIMGLSLELNENVQHKDEEWFQGTPEEIVSHLKTRGEFFWKNIVL